jgi:hypothetical protein
MEALALLVEASEVRSRSCSIDNSFRNELTVEPPIENNQDFDG